MGKGMLIDLKHVFKIIKMKVTTFAFFLVVLLTVSYASQDYYKLLGAKKDSTE